MSFRRIRTRRTPRRIRIESFDVVAALKYVVDKGRVVTNSEAYATDLENMLGTQDISLRSIHMNDDSTKLTLMIRDVRGNPFLEVVLTPTHPLFSKWKNVYDRV